MPNIFQAPGGGGYWLSEETVLIPALDVVMLEEVWVEADGNRREKAAVTSDSDEGWQYLKQRAWVMASEVDPFGPP